jgi:hypothetical protein
MDDVVWDFTTKIREAGGGLSYGGNKITHGFIIIVTG